MASNRAGPPGGAQAGDAAPSKRRTPRRTAGAGSAGRGSGAGLLRAADAVVGRNAEEGTA